MKVLILKPSSLGDVVHALPVLRCLKLHFPRAEIYWWVEAAWAPLLNGDPDLAGIVPFRRNGWSSPFYWIEFGRTLRWVRKKEFDWVIDLQSLARSGVFAWLAGGALTVGLDDPREGASTFYDWAVPRPSPTTHAVEWYLRVLDVLGVPVRWDFEWLPSHPTAAAVVRANWRPEGRRWIAIQPGARWPTKRWPETYFARLVRALAKAHPELHFVILGGREDRPLARAIEEADPRRCLDLTGATTLHELIEWIRLCELVVTNDTGPMHIAAALNRPIVSLFGPTDARRTGPFGASGQVLRIALPCAPCRSPVCSNPEHMECLKGLAPEIVTRAAQEILDRHA